MASSSTTMPGAVRSSSGRSAGTTGRSLTTESFSRPCTRRARTMTPCLFSVRSGVSKKHTRRICASSGSSSSARMAELCAASGTVSLSSTLSAPAESASTCGRSSSLIGRRRVLVAATGRPSDGRALAGKRRAQLRFLLRAERRLEHPAAVLRDPRHDLVGGAALQQDDDCRAALLEVLAQRLHEVLLAAIAVRGDPGAGRRPQRHAEERREEDEPDDHPRARALRGAAAGEMARVVQLHLAAGGPVDDDDVVDLDRLLLLEVVELGRDGA